MSVMQLANGKWRVQIRRKTLKVDAVYDTEAEARNAEAAALGLATEDTSRMTIRQLWERYEASQMFDEKRDNTKRSERNHIRAVLDELGDYAVLDLAADTGPIYDYMDKRARAISQRTKKKYSPTTRRLEIAALSSLIAYAKHRRIVRENFVSNISRPVSKKRKRRVHIEEQGKLSIFARNSDPAVAQAARFLLLIRHLACRPGELVELLIEDVNLSASELTFRDTKNHTDRCVHVSSEAAALLHLQLASAPAECPFVFQTWSRYKRKWVHYNYAHGVTLLRELQVIGKDMHAHAGRREFISRAIEAGLPLLTIKKQTGHKSTQALEIYDEALSLAPEIRAQIDALADTVKQENLLGAFEAAGLTQEQRAKLLKMLGKDGWVNPFPGDKK